MYGQHRSDCEQQQRGTNGAGAPQEGNAPGERPQVETKEEMLVKPTAQGVRGAAQIRSTPRLIVCAHSSLQHVWPSCGFRARCHCQAQAQAGADACAT